MYKGEEGGNKERRGKYESSQKLNYIKRYQIIDFKIYLLPIVMIILLKYR